MTTSRISLFTFGTVQLGVPYGIANRTGQPTRADAVALVRRAVTQGVFEFDCARGYGDAEAVLGEAFGSERERVARITTKLDPLDDVADASVDDMLRAAEKSVALSMELLRVDALDALLLHRWSHHDVHGGAIWRQLVDLRRAGRVRRLGASVYRPDEAMAALRDPEVGQLQIPFNLLDARWRSAEMLSSFASRPDVIVHARSALLQGLLAAPADAWPRLPGVDPSAFIEPLDRLVRELGRRNRADLCLAFVRGQSWLHSVVLGMETDAQLTQNLELFERPHLSVQELDRVIREIPSAPEILVNPSLWNKV